VLLEIADDELILGWRNSEWTGIAPFLEEDVAFSSIAQNEIGHARALYELAAAELGTTADELAFDRAPEEYRSAPLVELRRLEWARTIARHWLYETADEIRLGALKDSDDDAIAGLAAKMDREETYHRIHADMWVDRLLAAPEGRERLNEAVDELWPYALGVLDAELRPALRAKVEERLGRALPEVEAVPRGVHEAELAALWEEMTTVRRSAPAGARW
jgi:ring-1,2-phenylacetyl-CoA epoxidase subunit PaaC